jgi:hypothetical protein
MVQERLGCASVVQESQHTEGLGRGLVNAQPVQVVACEHARLAGATQGEQGDHDYAH